MKSKITQLLSDYEQVERMRLVRYRAKYTTTAEGPENDHSLLS